jgi:4-hydroxy-3-methylbut-2-enyl diphosphate reductase
MAIDAPTGQKINLRRPDVMETVQAQVEQHYRSEIVERVRASGHQIQSGDLTIKLAKEFGFCYGVERAIDLAYAARKVFPDQPLYILGEIIHNPEVNDQIRAMGIKFLSGKDKDADINDLVQDDVVIIPAFGTEVSTRRLLEAKGCRFVDTTCGDVMSVWKRVRGYAKQGFTSIIHGKAEHEETRATSSRAMGDAGNGHFLVVLTLDDVDYVCDYIRKGGNRDEFLKRFAASASKGFDPDLHLKRVGVANQTTMLKSETEELQRRVQKAVEDRDGVEAANKNFQVFDTICGATQERQDSLFDMLRKPLDVLLVVGGYNSSNTTHLVEIGEKELPTFFIRTAECLKSFSDIVHFDLHLKAEKTSYSNKLASNDPVVVGVTAGASCPNNLVEDTIIRVFELRGIPKAEVMAEAERVAAPVE